MLTKADLCRFGLEAKDEEGQTGPARKRTGFLTSSWTMLEELNVVCDGTHTRHSHLINGKARCCGISARTMPGSMQRSIQAEVN